MPPLPFCDLCFPVWVGRGATHEMRHTHKHTGRFKFHVDIALMLFKTKNIKRNCHEFRITPKPELARCEGELAAQHESPGPSTVQRGVSRRGGSEPMNERRRAAAGGTKLGQQNPSQPSPTTSCSSKLPAPTTCCRSSGAGSPPARWQDLWGPAAFHGSRPRTSSLPAIPPLTTKKGKTCDNTGHYMFFEHEILPLRSGVSGIGWDLGDSKSEKKECEPPREKPSAQK